MSAISNYIKCKTYMNKYVSIKTKRGTYKGKIVKVDKKKVYLQVSSFRDGNKAHTSFFPFILSLVLFDLLVITLLSTRHRRRF
ncbi:hypothetical protein [Paenibacillus piri]|uniref:KOW domain-containing protein n=1 Tax=Paenibacillus piri TaxID=2547395 RepID=A0A4R5KP44_9BACL|nr:hypothetical protein [Paenibacillus piri]TDF97469.1 hypothetical protein E1757_12660 [Paenibacillus piri]